MKRFLRKALPITLLIFAPAITTHAQYYSPHRDVELTPFGGMRFGGKIDVSSGADITGVDYLTLKTTWNYGAMLDVSLVPNLQAEFMYNHEPTVIGEHSIDTGQQTDIKAASVDMYQWSVLYEFAGQDAKLKPYAVAGLGFTNFDSAGVLPFSNRFSYNVGGGIKYFFNRNVGIRMEVRYSPSRTTTSQALFFDPFFGFYTANVANHAEQGQANIGLILRF